MPVQDFIPITDVKTTVEKEVKRKPSVDELTTVETPGKPVPADNLLENSQKESKPKRKKVIPKKDADKIERIGEYTLIITEKPQAAEKIASALGKSKKIFAEGVSYFEVQRNGKKILVSSAVGHLFGLEYVPGQKGWPIFQLEWRPSYERKNAAFTKKYFFLLKKLSKGAKEIIVATDYDVEGEVIGWNVVRFICHRNDAKRMKFSTLTKNELEKSFEEAMQTLDWGQAYAGETRHTVDWLYGINLSRALMSAIKRVGSFKLLSIGRVQGPALKIIVDREREIKNFKSQPYWQVFALVDKFPLKHPKDIFEKKELEKFKDIKSGKAETKESKENIIPPHPFDLTTLQKEAYRVHRISPSQTLALAQKLYLEGLISYPRTSSQKIPFAVQPRKILKSLEKNFPEAKEAKREKPVEGKKSDPAHPSIYPTGEFKKLFNEQKQLYELIVKRFIAVFSADAKVSNKRVVVKADKDEKITFTASGLKIEEKGWIKVYPAALEEKNVPTLNGNVKIDEIKFEEKETQPPKRYTPASLISLLEKKNLGTKSTRSTIVDTLFERGYLDGKSIEATPLGMQLIESLEQHSPIIIDEALTRHLEEEMEKIQNSKTDLEKKEHDVIEKTKKIINDIAKEFKVKETEIGKSILKGVEDLRKVEQENNTVMPCTTCGKGNIRIMFSPKTRRYFLACSAYPECRQTFSLPPNSLIKKADKECGSCRFPKLLAIRKGKRPWEFCFNQNCPTNIKRIEEYRERKEKEAGQNSENEEKEISGNNEKANAVKEAQNEEERENN